VFNGAGQPANLDLGNFSAQAGPQSLGVMTVNRLVKNAKNRAWWKQFGMAMVGGMAAGTAASQRDTYTGSVYTPYGSVHSIYSAPSAMGQVQAMAIAGGTAYGIVSIQNRLDQTVEALGNEVVQTSTIYPGQTYAGKIVLEKIRSTSLPQRVMLTVTWNGEQYPFAFQLAKDGTPAPVFTAITSADAARGMSTAVIGSARGSDLPAVPPAANPFRVDNLDQLVRRTAELMPRPTELDDGTAITHFAAAGDELTLTARPAALSERSATLVAICQQRAISALLHQGATVRAVFNAPRGRDKAEDLVVTGQSCGFY